MASSLMSAVNVQAAEYWPDNISVSSGAAIVVELETGTVLYEKDADTSYYPASITKVMTALLALENCDLDEVVTFSEEAVYKNEGDTSHIAREVGEKMTMENCLYGMMLESANECAWAIGEHVGGGSMDEFVNMMNAKAKELGCTGTHFANPNGLPDPDHYVTARDMSLIARAAYQYPEFRKISSTRAYTIPADNKKEAYSCNNTHGMISNHRGSSHLYEYALGGKTGYTDEAGNTLVTYAKNDNTYLVSVVLQSVNGAYSDTKALLDYGFNNFSRTAVKDLPSKITRHLLPAEKYILKDYKDDMLFETRRTASVSLPSGVDSNALEKTYSITKNPAGLPLLTVTYTYNDHVVGSARYYQTRLLSDQLL